MFPIEADSAWIVGSGLNADFFQPRRQSALLEPREDVSAQSSVTFRRFHPEKDKVCRSVSIVHDSDRQEASALMNHSNVRGFAPDGPKDPAWRVTPAESVFDEVA